MFKKILYALILIIIVLFLYIKIKYRFWSSQPVFHIYNIRQWLFPSGILQHSLPPKTKFYDLNVITKSFKHLSTKKKALMCNLIQGHYLYNKKAKYTPTKSDILEYFNFNKPAAIISLYIDPIPNKILDAENIWNSNGGKSTPKICALVSKFIKCNFIAENFEDWENYFDNKNYGEFSAVKVNVVGVDFSTNGLAKSVSLFAISSKSSRCR